MGEQVVSLLLRRHNEARRRSVWVSCTAEATLLASAPSAHGLRGALRNTQRRCGELAAEGGEGKAGLFAYFAVLPGIFGTLMLWPWLLERLGEVPEQQEYLVQLQDLGGTGLWVGILLATLVIPFAEEVLFRGFLQPLLVQNFRDLGGVVITAVLFAALHGQSAFLPIFVLALVLGGVMLRTQRLLAAYAIHVTHNGLTIWMTLLASSVEGDAAPAAGLVCGSLLHLP